MIPDNIITKIKQVVNVFETSSITGRYDIVAITKDGPGGAPQISYGRSQTTEHSTLHGLISNYINAGGKYAVQLQPYLGQIGITSLADNNNFKALLKAAGSDPIMHQTQDSLFDGSYFNPAQTFFINNGFTLALSLLCIYDSYIQSGGIMGKLRQRFAAVPPASGGDEKTWILQYENVRHDFLGNNENAEVRGSVYRVNSLLKQITLENWDLIQPVDAHFLIVP